MQEEYVMYILGNLLFSYFNLFFILIVDLTAG